MPTLPHMCPFGSPGKSRDDRLRWALDLYHARVLSEVLVNQEMIMCGRPLPFFILVPVLERCCGQACMWPDTQPGIGGKRCVHRAIVWGSSRSRALVRCASSSWVRASLRATKSVSFGGAQGRSASDDALLLGIQVEPPLASAGLQLASNSFRTFHLCRQSFEQF